MYKAVEKTFDPAFVFLPNDEITISQNPTSINLLQLDPATKYEISISARTSAGRGPVVTIYDYTRPPSKKNKVVVLFLHEIAPPLPHVRA